MTAQRRERLEGCRAHQRRWPEQLRGLVSKALAVLKAAGLWRLQPLAKPHLLAYQFHADCKPELETRLNARAES
jgi:hypothetical protein